MFRRCGSRVLSVILLSLSSPTNALFTGNDQYNRQDLNSEKRIDVEYPLRLLTFRPFWEPGPMAREPRAYFRNSEGSLTTDELWIRREAGFRFEAARLLEFGYSLRQWEDFEQDFFDQTIFARVGPEKGPGFRLFGQPTSDKQDSDIGLGVDWLVDNARLAADFRFVDFNFNGKNRNGDRDRRDLYNIRMKAGWRIAETALELAWDLDTPVERELRDDDERFLHRSWNLESAFEARPWRLSAFWRNDRRSIDTLSSGIREQDFGREAGGGRLELNMSVGRHTASPGIEVQKRWAHATQPSVAPDFSRHRWLMAPFIEWKAVLNEKVSFPLGLYAGLAGGETRAFFSSQESVEQVLIQRIEESRCSIDMALFEFRSARDNAGLIK